MMRTAQLINVSIAVALAAAVGCNRAETEEQTQRAAADVKTAAARAGDTLADGWLTTRIQAQYFADDQIKARYIDVRTDDGVVTIKGFVETPAAHERALQIARSTSGVKQVKDEILIGQAPQTSESRPVATAGELPPAGSAAGPMDDGRVTSSIQATFFREPTIKGRPIDVTTQNGVVTLRGEVASEAERGQALMLARNVPGVQRVEDHLSVNAAIDPPSAPTASTPPPAAAPVDDATVLADVKSKLAADSELRTIDVSVKDGVLELRGTVPSGAARQRAVDLVRQTSGVAQVIDRLTLKKQS
jgi:hyperosmotically inducible periplasmic protein